MSTPIRPEPDPFSLALGRIEGRLDGIEKRLDGMDHRLDGVDKRLETLERYMVWGFGITWTLVIATGILSRLVHG
jgi:hypothetical protein